ncbi:ion transporter [Candidatus Peregrinibacteria bacterium]|nr:ion transporter [Candidatus Peregrinibacteria bacterium]
MNEPANIRRHHVQEFLWNSLEGGHGPTGKFLNALILVLILVSVILLPIELIRDFQKYSLVTETIEMIVTTVFTLEYITRIYAAPRKLRYIFSFWGLIDLLSIVPYYLSLSRVGTEVFRILRVARIVRILKIAHMKSSDETEESVKKWSRRHVDLLPGEEIEKVVMQHPIFFLANMTLPLSLGILTLLVLLFGKFHEIAITISAVLFLVTVLSFWKVWLDYHYDVLYITNMRIIFQNKYLFGQGTQNVEYPYITNIRPAHTGIISFLLGYGSIIINTASDFTEISQKHARDHQKVAQYIEKKCQECKYIPITPETTGRYFKQNIATSGVMRSPPLPPSPMAQNSPPPPPTSPSLG